MPYDDKSRRAEFYSAEFVITAIIVVATLLFDFMTILYKPMVESALIGAITGILNIGGFIVAVQYLAKYKRAKVEEDTDKVL